MHRYDEERAQTLLVGAEELMKRYQNGSRLIDLEDDCDYWLHLQVELWHLAYDYGKDYLSEQTRARIERFLIWADSVFDKTDELIMEFNIIESLKSLSKKREQ